MLAVADSQIVVLHKVDQGQHHSYRLKGAEPHCRLLQYAHDSRSLFFTDNLHNSVQTYSLREDRVSEAAKAHPSPVTAFCVSTDSNLLLSCSADPPVIHLHNRQMNNTVDIKPRASAKAVIGCKFHPTRRSIFVLAFADGVVAAYDSSRLIRGERARAAARKGNVGSGGGEHIHSFSHLHVASISGGAGITGVEFIPGFKGRAVSVGEDGRLFIVDFERKDVLGSWHIGAPATCLSVRPAVGKDAGSVREAGWMLAIGTIHGRCFIFNADGTKVCEQVVDGNGGRVLDVEWVSGEVALPGGVCKTDSASSTTKSPLKSRSTPISSATPQSENVGDSITVRQPSTQPGLSSLAEDSGSDIAPDALTRLPTNPPMLPEIQRDAHWEDVVERYSEGYMKLFSPVKTRKPKKALSDPARSAENVNETRDPKERVAKQDDQRSAISAPLLWDERPSGKKARPTPIASSVGLEMFDGNGSRDISGATSSSKRTADTVSVLDAGKRIPSSVISGRSGSNDSTPVPLLSVVNSAAKVSNVADAGQILSEIRSLRGDTTDKGGAGRALALFAPYMPNRPGGGRLTGLGKKKAGGSSTAGDECSVNMSMGMDGQSRSKEDDQSLASTLLLSNDEATIRDASVFSEQPKEQGAREHSQLEPVPEAQPQPEKVHSEADSDDGDIWLVQGADVGDISFTMRRPSVDSETSRLPNSTVKIKEAKRKAPLDDEEEGGYEADVYGGTTETSFFRFADTSMAALARGPMSAARGTTAKASAGTGSVRSLAGSNKSRRIATGGEESAGIASRGRMTPLSQYRSVETGTGAGRNGVGAAEKAGGVEGKAWEEAVDKAKGELLGEIRGMYKEMVKMFEEQGKVVDKFAKELVDVRRENERLRREILEAIKGK